MIVRVVGSPLTEVVIVVTQSGWSPPTSAGVDVGRGQGNVGSGSAVATMVVGVPSTVTVKVVT